MAHANIQHPIVLKRRREHSILISRGVDESNNPDAPVAVADIARPRGRDWGAGADDRAEAEEPCLPPECWYG